MPIKLGFFTDTHFRYETPEERIDNFLKSSLLKLEEIGQIFEDEQVDYILFGGDLYDSDHVASSVITGVQSILKSWNKDIIGVIGSHDYYGYQMKTLKSTALGITESAGLITLLGGVGHQESIVLRDTNSPCTEVTIEGLPHTYTFTDDEHNMYSDKLSKFQIQIVHVDLNDKIVPWRHILIKDGLTDSDLVLSGHYHPGWKKAIVKKSAISNTTTTYINPGSIARMKNTGVFRIPRVCIIEVTEDTFTHKFIELKSAMANPFKDKKQTVVDEEPMVDIAKFMDMISGVQVDAIDIKQQLSEVAVKANISDNILSEVFSLLDRANGSEDD
jgi:predicted phosphodiesterase